ncbi:hypothetical protein [Deinococcus budaensis]|uniref:Sugar lactone lactonase YvrE n=1 Tax=Deinococcus budaensis TaxID=1665626 RepID=A0A7W8GCM2_9DEIO|nr:hypothetical protein [Deinococcus budaensis]MBB5233096.1 sugar lactone lactonase YvrE [Deinococcus budaensis]
MKRLQLPSAMLGLTVLLTACPGPINEPPRPPAPTTHSLTVKLGGVPSAPVTITNTTTKTQVFSGTLEGGKTFGDLKAGDVFEVTGAAVNGYTAPATQTVTLDANKTVTLAYAAAPVTPPAPTLHTLTVKLEGTGSAPVTVTNETTKIQVFSGFVEGSKTLENLKAGDVFRVEAGSVDGFTVPTAQTVTLDASKTVTLSFAALPGTTLDPSRVRGTLDGWTFGTGDLKAYFSFGRTVVAASTPTITLSGNVDAGLPTPGQLSPFLEDCTFTGQRSAPDFGSEMARGATYSRQGDFLGFVTEQTTDGRDVVRVYSDTAATFKGTAICPGSQRLDLDLRVVQGWNAFSIAEVSSGEYRYDLRFRNLEAGARTTLTLDRARESVSVFFRDTSDLTLRAGKSATREVVFAQTGGLSGQVTLETNVPGVTVTPSTVTLPTLGTQGAGGRGLQALSAAVQPQALGAALTFSADENAASYSGPLTVIVKKGATEVGRGTLSSFRLTAPSVMANVPYGTSLSLARGETRGVTFSVFSQEFFSGTTTVTLSGLPAGVTASTETVTLAESGSAQVTVQVSASADAPLATVNARVTGPKVRNTQGAPDTVPVTVTPARTPLDLNGFQRAVPTPGGLWVITPEQYSGGASSFTLLRMQGGAVAQREVLTGRPTLLPAPNGDALLVTEVNSAGTLTYTLTRLRPDGTRTARTFGVQDGQNFARGAVDAQGNLWFLKDTSSATSSAALARVNFEAGTVTVVDATRPYRGYESLSASPDGQTVVVLPSSNTTLYRVDVGSAAVSTVTLDRTVSYFEAAATDNGGTVYLPQYDGVLRVSSSGTTALLPLTGSFSLLGLDRAAPGTLWLSRASEVIRLDTASGSTQVIPLSGSTSNPNSFLAGGTPDASGGVWAVTGESAYDQATGNMVTRYFASLLK